MRLTCFYTPDFEPLAIRFLSGISEPLTLNCIAIDPTASGGLGGGIQIWEQKTRMLIEEASRVSDAANDLSVILDIDMAIYGPLQPAVAAHWPTTTSCTEGRSVLEGRPSTRG